MRSHPRLAMAVKTGEPVRKRNRGMSLVEVLVTVVIISVGLLGVAALQLATLRDNYDAYVRSQAAMLAADILDRMRANRDAALGNQYRVALGSTTAAGTGAQNDVAAWKATLAAQLPSGDGALETMALDAAGRVEVVRVTIQWGERGSASPIVFQTSSSI